MKALSVRQPWAYLLVVGAKTVEVRSWRTSFRGSLLICASASPRRVVIYDEASAADVLLPTGCMIGVVELVDVRPMVASDSKNALCDFDPHAFAWVVRPISMCQPKRILGRLHLFDVPTSKIAKVPKGESIFDASPLTARRQPALR